MTSSLWIEYICIYFRQLPPSQRKENPQWNATEGSLDDIQDFIIIIITPTILIHYYIDIIRVMRGPAINLLLMQPELIS